MERRAFLTMLAGSPLIFGLRELLGQEPQKSDPEWFQAAIKRMKETHRYGLVIVVPDEPGEREQWGKALIDRHNELHARNQEPFGVAVLIAMTSTLAAKLVGHDPRCGPARIDLRPDGGVLRRVELKFESLEPSKFADAFTATDEQLKEQGPAIEKTLPEAVLKAAEQLYRPGTYSDEAAKPLLNAKTADAILPWLVWKCRWAESKAGFGECTPTEPSGLRTAIERYWARHLLADADPCLPYGVKVEILAETVDPCPPCGMAVMPAGRTRKFLSFLEK